MADLAKEAAELDAALAGAAAPSEEAGNAAAPPEERPLEIANPLSTEIGGLFAALGAGLGQFFPSIKIVLTDEKCGELGGALAPVLEKWGLAKHFAGFAWRVELQAVMVVIPTAIALRAAVMHDLGRMKKAAADEPAAPPAPESSAPPAPPAPPAVPVLKAVEKKKPK